MLCKTQTCSIRKEAKKGGLVLHHPITSPRHATLPSPHPHHLKPTRTRATADGDDLITRFVGKLFGQKVLEDPEPGGLKRLSDTALQELYPATLDEFAAPVVRDCAHGWWLCIVEVGMMYGVCSSGGQGV